MLLMILIFISVGFLTLLERKVLSLSQMRLGPNKVMLWGLFQPLLDGLKLLKKSLFLNMKIQYLMYWLSVCFILMLNLLNWMSVPYKYWGNKSLVFLWVFVLISLNSYCLLYIGIFSGSKFAWMGSIRSVCQSISLEIVLLMSLQVFFNLFSKNTYFMKNNLNMSFIMMFFLLIFLVFILIDTHRAPMDLSEGESELVSGFNIEYGAVFFTIIFLSEYSYVLLLSMLSILYFFMMSFLLFSIIIFSIMLLRSCYPRCRYDYLMNYCWLKIFPMFTICCLVLTFLKIL